jgi:arginine decarboxylase
MAAPIAVVWGTAGGRTPLDATDAALTAAGVGEYNLVDLSSVVPPDRPVIERGRAQRSWPVGSLAAAVVARTASADRDRVAAGLGWSVAADGSGVFYEATGADAAACEADLRAGLAGARERRSRSWPTEPTVRTVSRAVGPDEAGAAVVVALYGRLPAPTW